MNVGAVCERVRQVATVRASAGAERAELEGGIRSIAVVRSWLAAAEADLAARLAEVSSFPEQAISEAARGSQGEASRALERSSTLSATPALADALDDGDVTAGHVDAVTKVAKGLEGPQRDKLLERADRLVGIARHGSVNDFRKRLEREAESLRSDDGSVRFERQKRAARLRRWTDADGMWCLQGRFDPLTGVRLNARLQAEIEAAFAESVPEGCPTDPQAKSEFLAACAMARILDGSGVAQRAGRPEFVVVIEADSQRAEPGTHRHSDEARDTQQPGNRREPAARSTDTDRATDTASRSADGDCGEPGHTGRAGRQESDAGACGRLSSEPDRDDRSAEAGEPDHTELAGGDGDTSGHRSSASSDDRTEPGGNGGSPGVGEAGRTDRADSDDGVSGRISTGTSNTGGDTGQDGGSDRGGSDRGGSSDGGPKRGGTDRGRSSDGGPDRGGTDRGGSSDGGPDRGGTDGGGPECGGPERGGPDRGGSSDGGPDRGEANRGGTDRGGNDRGGPERGGPDGGGPDRGGNDRDGTSDGGPDRGGPDRGGTDGGGPDRGGSRDGGPERGGPDASGIDERSDGARLPRVDWGLPVEIPWSVLIELFGDADVYPVVVRNGVVLYAPGELNLGRTTRLANRAQRRALRALYSTCAIPGCETHFDRCKIHHVHWWRHGGRTDLENLLPLCVHHHTKVHNFGWVITLGPGRTVTLRLPDGTVHNTDPPRRSAA